MAKLSRLTATLSRVGHRLRQPKVLVVLVAGLLLCATVGFRPVQLVNSWGGTPGQVQGIYLPFGWVPDPFRPTSGQDGLYGCNLMLLGWYEENPGSLLFKVRRGGTGPCDGGAEINLVSLALNVAFWLLVIWNIAQIILWLVRRRRRVPLQWPTVRALLTLLAVWAILFVPANFYTPRWVNGDNSNYLLGAYLPHAVPASWTTCDPLAPPDYSFPAAGLPFRYSQPDNCGYQQRDESGSTVINYDVTRNSLALVLNAIFWLIVVADGYYALSWLKRHRKVGMHEQQTATA